MKKHVDRKKLNLDAQTVRMLEPKQLEVVQGGQRGSTVPRSWCESCETAC